MNFKNVKKHIGCNKLISKLQLSQNKLFFFLILIGIQSHFCVDKKKTDNGLDLGGRHSEKLKIKHLLIQFFLSSELTQMLNSNLYIFDNSVANLCEKLSFKFILKCQTQQTVCFLLKVLQYTSPRFIF